MKTYRYLLVVFLVVAFNVVVVLAIVNGQSSETPHWEYEGEAGPDNWGKLDPSFALCSTGRAQSPIDVVDAIPLDLSNINFSYSPSAMNIFNNGHTIQVNYDAGSSITYNENTYQLVQFHFHHPSEHFIDGKPSDMEIHFVHRDDVGNLAVVGVMLVAGDADNEAYAPVFDNLPAEEGEPETTDITVNAADLLPTAKTFYTYTGSLTTPPCSQGVRWLLLTEPVELSEAQIEAFAAIFELNARPVQPLNERDLLMDES